MANSPHHEALAQIDLATRMLCFQLTGGSLKPLEPHERIVVANQLLMLQMDRAEMVKEIMVLLYGGKPNG